MHGHDTLFVVYRHPSGEEVFALGEQNDDVFWMVSKTAGDVVVKQVKFQAGIQEMAAKLKLGFICEANKMFFNQRKGEFRTIHPDLDWKGLDWVLAAAPGNIGEACEQVANAVRAIPGNILFEEEVTAWAQQQRHNAIHVTAFSDHPVWTLALADASIRNGWPLRASPKHHGVPDTPPSTAPLQWSKWLSGTFKASLIAETQKAMGWAEEEFIHSVANPPLEGDLAAFL